MKAAPTAMKAPRCPELPTAKKTTPMARNTASGARDLAGEPLGVSVMCRTVGGSAASDELKVRNESAAPSG
jgi:hypothetical protein